MLHTLLLSIVTAFIIIGAHIVINWEGMLLYGIKRAYDFIHELLNISIPHDDYQLVDNDSLSAKFWAWLCKPLFTCPYCMSSVWSIAITYIYTNTLTWFIIPQILLTCGVVALLWGIVSWIKEN